MPKKYQKTLITALATIIVGIISLLGTKGGKQFVLYQKVAATRDYSIQSVEGVPIKVLKVIDGDTIELINGDKLRYIGIDTPEEVDQRKPVQCFAQEAADENKALVDGKMITYYKDKTERDQYGRLLGFVYLSDGTFVNEKLVEDGFAFAYRFPPDISKSEIFSKAQDDARNSNRGLWKNCSVSKLKSGREQTNAL
jgi:micrococcal nuclease